MSGLAARLASSIAPPRAAIAASTCFASDSFMPTRRQSQAESTCRPAADASAASERHTPKPFSASPCSISRLPSSYRESHASGNCGRVSTRQGYWPIEIAFDSRRGGP
jgi:hypothetical protein